MNKMQYKQQTNVRQSASQGVMLASGITMGFMIGLCFTLLVRLIWG